ncbi:hypothetical protein JCM11641_007643 [Rhodosporidiobolus odoratus]
MSGPPPAKRARTSSPTSESAQQPLPSAPTALRNKEAGPTADASGSVINQDAAQEPEDQEHTVTAEELDEKARIYDLVAEEYHDIVTELPLEYHRAFALLKELEDQQQTHTTNLRTSLEAYIASLSNPSFAPSPAPSTSTADEPLPKISDNAKEKMQELARLATAGVRAGEDKVGLAVSLYELVDRHIRRLDADLAKSEDSLVLGLRQDTLPSHDAPAAGRKSPPGATTSRAAIALGEHDAYDADLAQSGEDAEGSVAARRTRKKPEKTAQELEKEREWKRRKEMQKLERREKKKEEQQVQVGMPIDPNEPVYCYCQRVSFGEMIACENEDCSREWFHLDCVSLDAAPEGSWYCDDCMKELNVDPKTMKPR